MITPAKEQQDVMHRLRASTTNKKPHQEKSVQYDLEARAADGGAPYASIAANTPTATMTAACGSPARRVPALFAGADVVGAPALGPVTLKLMLESELGRLLTDAGMESAPVGCDTVDVIEVTDTGTVCVVGAALEDGVLTTGVAEDGDELAGGLGVPEEVALCELDAEAPREVPDEEPG